MGSEMCIRDRVYTIGSFVTSLPLNSNENSAKVRDDEQSGDSNSIINQKKMLEKYATEQGFTNLLHYFIF